MKENFKRVLFSGLGGLVISYAAYFLVLSNIRLSSLARLGLVFALLAGFSIAIFFLYKRFDSSPVTLGGIAALFILLNLASAVRVDLLDLPYTITLLPTQTIHLTPENNQTPVKIRSYGTELITDLNLDQLTWEQGWALDGKGNLVQTDGAGSTLRWTGKPGQYIYFEADNCPKCGDITLRYGDEEITYPLDDGQTQIARITYQFPGLAWHKAFNFLTYQGALLILSLLLINAARLIQLQPKPGGQKKNKPSFLSRIPAEVWLVVFPIVIFAFKIQPVIFNDDWCQIIQPVHEDSFVFFDATARRPMHVSLAWVIARVFPIHQAVFMMQITHLVVIIMIGLVIYHLLARLLGSDNWLAFLGALLCVVFPNDYTYFYLSVLGTRFAFFLTLLSLLLFFRYLESNRILNVWIAMVLVFFGLLTYEGQFGIYLVWPLLLGILFTSQLFQKRIVGLVVYYLPAAIFPVWRLLIQPLFYQDSKLENLGEGVSGIITSINWAIKVTLGGFQLPYQDSSWLTAKNIAILAAAVGLGIIFFLIAREKTKAVGDDHSRQGRTSNIRLLIAGILLWGSGYVPIILNYTPNIWGHLSRVNTFAVPGAVLLMIAVLKTIADSLDWKGQVSNLALNLSLLSLILFGSVVHIQVQESINRTWTETKSFYQQTFDLAPDIAQGTQIYLYLQEGESSPTTHRPLITSLWEPRCAFDVFYNFSTTNFSYSYQHILTPEFPGMNILGGSMHKDYLTPQFAPENLLAFTYDPDTRQVNILEDLTPLFGADFQRKYHPLDHIIPLEQKNLSRRLVD